MKKQKIVVIVGPTASGKTALSIALAKQFNGEVISADSRQVYTGLDIGTGKVTKKEMAGIRHHLIDVCSPKKTFTADDFVERARKAITDITDHGALPIVAGGTGFYMDALTGRIVLPNVPPNEKLRTKLETYSLEKLYTMLERKDPQRARTIQKENKRRLIRALEIAEAIGASPIPATDEPYDVLWIGISPSLDERDKKIHLRALTRMKKGMLAEAKKLHEKGLSYKRMEELGLEYRALARHLRGLTTREQLIEEIETGNRQYARKQLTYWKRNAQIQWFNPNDQKKITSVVKKWLAEK